MDRQERARKPRSEPRRSIPSLRVDDADRDPAVQPLPPSWPGLPLTLGNLVGRERDRSEVASLLDGFRLVTLTGPGGVGKTRLALQLGADFADLYDDGVWFVDLGSVVDAAHLLQAVASALKLEQQPAQAVGDTLEAFVRHRHLLLIFDNCEHLLSPCVDLISQVLTAGPRVSILATTRERLNVVGEVVWEVKPLSVPAPGEDREERLAECEAVRLFLDRARRVRPGLVVDAAALRAMADIARCLDGIPLAIELAAARAHAMTPKEIASRLDDRFPLLVDGSRTAAPRHQTLRASLDWSYDLLSSTERALLRRFSVFSGGWTLHAAEAVCGCGPLEPGQVVTDLARLVAKSLVIAEATGDAMRYRLLDSVRQYGEERLVAAGEEVDLRERHAAWCLLLAERVERRSEMVAPGLVDRLEPELDNVRAALRWTLSTGRTKMALELAAALTPLWLARGSYTEGLEWLEQGLSQTAGSTSDERARALRAATLLAFRTSKFPLAARAAEEGARGLEDEGPGVRAGRLKQLGYVQLFTQGPDAALPLFEESLAIARELDEPVVVADSLHACGRAHLFKGDARAARQCFEECMEAFRQGGDSRADAALIGLGWTAMVLGEHVSSEGLLRKGLAVVEEAGEKYDTALAKSLLGELAGLRGEFDECRGLLEESLSLARAIRAPFPLVKSLAALGRLELAQGRLDVARSLVEEAVALAREVGLGYLLARCLQALGEVARAAGDAAGARAVFEEALAIAGNWGDKQAVARTKYELATDLSRAGDDGEAASLHHEALALHAEVGDAAGVADSLEALARLAAGHDRLAHATRLFAAACAVRKTHGASVRPPEAERERHENDVARVRDSVGPAEFEGAWAEGAALSLDEAVAYARRSRGPRRRPSRGWASLTPTEREVVALVEQGLTNAEIGERLFVSPKTVRNHLSHVFAKLGVSSRLELAKTAWGEAD